jgi:ABC-type glycerol-3-phosphate transport system substrate-binding protein
MSPRPPRRSAFAAISRRQFLGGTGAGLGLIAAGSLSSCGLASSGGGSSTTTLDFVNRWTDPTSVKVANSMFSAFQKSTGIKVNNQVQPNSGSTYQPAVRTAFSSSSPPALATDIAGPEVYDLAQAGVLMDLTDFYNATIKPRAKAGAIAGSELNGKIWGICDGTNVGNCIWYNPQLLDQYKVDPADLTTLPAWLDAMAKIKKDGGTPIVIGAKDQWPGGHYLNDLVQRWLGSAAATTLYNRTVLPHQPSSPKWTDQPVISAFEDYLKFKPLFEDGFLGEASATTDSLFLEGKSVFYEMGSWILSEMQSTPPSFSPGVMLFPATPGGQGSLSEVTLSSDTTIASAKADRSAVEKYLEFFTSPANLTTFAGGMLDFEPYQFDAASVKVSGGSAVTSLFAKVNDFLANAGPDGAALYNDEAINVNIYTKYIWQGSVGLMSGAVTPAQLAQQLETATVAAQKQAA